jgi:hypothetical protein
MKRFAFPVGGAALFVMDAEDAPDAGWMEVGPDVQSGDRFDAGQWVRPGKTEADVRFERDAALAASDWVVTRSLELGEPVPEAWTTYRAALRDVPEQPGFPTNVTWPQAPAQ